MSCDTHYVVKANALIEASYRLSVYEQRILLSCISQIRKGEAVTDQVMYRVTVSDIAAMAGVDQRSAYRHLKEASEKLYRREVRLEEYANGGGKRSVVLMTRWVQSVRYVASEGHVELRFSHDILPYISQLTREFTRYLLEDVAQLDSVHAVRLFELMMQWRDSGERTVSVEWLRDALQLERRYPAFKDFRRFVIEPSIAQINEKTAWQASWAPIKRGRRVAEMRFNFVPKQAGEMTDSHSNENNGDGSGLPDALVKRFARPGDSREDARRRALDAIHKAQQAERA